MVVGLLAEGWKRKNAALKALCEEIEASAGEKGVVLSFIWTKAHAENREHNRIDALARKEARSGWVRNASLADAATRVASP